MSGDSDWDLLSPEQQDAYNERIDADNEYDEAKELYNKSMSLTGPFVLGIIGVVLLGIYFIGLLPLLLAIVWAIVRVAGRSHAYQRYKDADATLKKLKENQ